MRYPRRLATLVSLLLDPRALVALITWPKFSLTSYQMISALIEQGVRPATVIDVGANVGQFAVATSKLLPTTKIYAFEPVADCIEQLRHNTRHLPHITITPIALGARSGRQQIHVNSHSHSSSLLPLADSHRRAFPDAAEVGFESIIVRTLDDATQGLSLRPPCLLKIDVQGYEPQVLKGSEQTLKKIEFILLEVSFRPLYHGEVIFTDILKTMEGYNYHFVRPVGWLSDPNSHEILQMDALFQRNAATPNSSSNGAH